MKNDKFKKWLKDQKMTVEGFANKARDLGVSVRVGTVHKWRQGVSPRITAIENLRSKFPTIRF